MWFGIFWDSMCIIIGFVFLVWMMNDDNWGAATLWVIYIMIFALLLGLTIKGGKDDQRDEKAKDAAKAKVTAACYPYAVTHKVEKDNKITFSCANDGKLQVVKLVKGYQCPGGEEHEEKQWICHYDAPAGEAEFDHMGLWQDNPTEAAKLIADGYYKV